MVINVGINFKGCKVRPAAETAAKFKRFSKRFEKEVWPELDKLKLARIRSAHKLRDRAYK